MKTATQETIRISPKVLRNLVNDPRESARALKLVYVNDHQPGITRKRAGKSFVYYQDGKKVTDPETLARIRSLVLPPAWENVWICARENGHLQATGIDVRGRKQYRYHDLWSALRNETKFSRLYEFGKCLPVVREKIEKDLSLPGICPDKILAAVISIMELTPIRVGNSAYEKLYGSFGLTTMKTRHVNVSGTHVRFTFKGKKGVQHTISLKSRRLSGIIKKCLDIPGKDLFTFYDDKGTVHSIDSGMVNDYIRQLSGGDYSSKDFRTWSGTVRALQAFREAGAFESAAEAHRKVVEVLDCVSKHLGNTRTVCKKYYVHPALIRLYEEQGLHTYFDAGPPDDIPRLSDEEKILLKILEKELKSAVIIPV